MNENKDRNDSAIPVPPQTAADVRLLVLDLDGTIVDESNRIRDSVVQAIHSAQRRGVGVAIATGRRYQSALHAYHSIGSTLPLICHEGALIREPNTGILHRHWHLEPRVVAQILDYAAHLCADDRLSVHFHVEDELYVSNLNSVSIEFFEGSKVEPIVLSDLRQLLNRAITKVIILGDDFQLIARLCSRLKNSQCRTQIRQYKSITLLEALHPVVNKRPAVTYLTEEILGLRPENVIAIGNDFTDIEMLQYAGIGVAMGNAPAALKLFADWVTTNIDQDGVARAVEKLILSDATVGLGSKPVGSLNSFATLNRLS